MEYAYSAGALRGDPGDGLAVFQTAKQQAAKDALLGGECYDATKLAALGTKPSRLLRPRLRQRRRLHLRRQLARHRLHAWRRRRRRATRRCGCRAGRKIVRRSTIRRAACSSGTAATTRRSKPGWAECANEKIDKDLSAAGATATVTYCFDPQAAHRDTVRSTNVRLRQSVDRRARRHRHRCRPRARRRQCPGPTADGNNGHGCETPPNDF